MTDYRRMLELAGLNEAEITRIAQEAEQQDMDDEREAADNARHEKERELEQRLIKAATSCGLTLWDKFPVNLMDDEVEVKVDAGTGIPIAALIRFANVIAGNQIGSDVQINATSDMAVLISFKPIG